MLKDALIVSCPCSSEPKATRGSYARAAKRRVLYEKLCGASCFPIDGIKEVAGKHELVQFRIP